MTAEEEIKDMLRHIHNDVFNVIKKQEILEHKITMLAYIIQDSFRGELDDKNVEQIVNLDPECYSNLDENYTSIDEVDKILWEEHIRKKKEKEREQKT